MSFLKATICWLGVLGTAALSQIPSLAQAESQNSADSDAISPSAQLGGPLVQSQSSYLNPQNNGVYQQPLVDDTTTLDLSLSKSQGNHAPPAASFFEFTNPPIDSWLKLKVK